MNRLAIGILASAIGGVLAFIIVEEIKQQRANNPNTLEIQA